MPEPTTPDTESTRPLRRPSPPWRGAVSTGLMFLGSAWLLAYTLLALPPLEALGAWNYVGILALVPVTAVLSRSWRGEPYARPDRTARLH